MENQKHHAQKVLSVLNNEEGAVLIAAIMILVLLTIISIASMGVSNTEVQISGNELRYYQHLYRAEGATMEAVEQLEQSLDPNDGSLIWLETSIDSVTVDEIKTWQFGSSPNPASSVLGTAGIAETSFMAVSDGIAPGTTLDMVSSKVYRYNIYGRSSLPERGTTIIEIGYRKAF